MANTRFSPFELLLLKSRNQTDTAALLLLAWVAASQGEVSAAAGQRLSELAAGFRHGHELQPILDAASPQDFAAIQLAAEVLQKDCHGEKALPFLRHAIALAMVDDKLAAATNHVLRFLADLLGTSPQRFSQLFSEVAGEDFGAPDDPSRADYWHARERARQQQSHHQHSHQHQHERQHEEEPSQQHSYRGSSHGQSWHRSERESGSYRADDRPPPSDRTLRALTVLGLEADASRGDIKKAYRRMAQIHHPDRFFARGENVTAAASQRFQTIKKAYEYLMQDARFV
ncbi:DnaJ domain-containing protein [Modicisalibacter muralis]|uniref:DnaJ domain-containing protein n=1 Tax=Modicisalibacter muralis TaxID=119000 RepID=A0A1G9I819_9GAMM|nr:J domain-containing protein [Halomonas muralis]SDL21381.1 DnaJ domain-containing protein [Halomonas muralis]